MAGTKDGAYKAKMKILARDPNFYARIGKAGGEAGTTGGFASTIVGKDGLTGSERARVAGANGGRISRRSKKAVPQDIALGLK
jgi:uncharacterized protein